MSMLTAAQKNEALRAAALEWLASRPSLAHELVVIHQRLNRSGLLDFEAGQDEVLAALTFLESEKYVEHRTHRLGSTLFYQVTAAGVLAFERGTLTP